MAIVQKTRRVVGYFPGWAIHARNYHVTDIPAAQLTHIVYAFADVSAGGECVPLSSADDQVNFPQLRALKQQQPGLSTLISVGGAKNSGNFPQAAGSDAARQRFAQSCLQFMQQNGFDGIDIDWEFPGTLDKQNFTALLGELRRQLDAQGQADGRHYLLTIAAPAKPGEYAHMDLSQVHPYLDWINLMTYNFYLATGPTTDFLAALYPPPDDPAPTRLIFNVDAAVHAYRAAGVPADKLVVGVHWAGIGWQGVPGANNGLHQTNTGPAKGTYETGSFDYTDLVNNYLPTYTRYWHAQAQVPWLYNPTTGIMISYEDPQSLGRKADYVAVNQLGGLMIWELSADDKRNSLLNPLAQSTAESQIYFCCDDRRRNAVAKHPTLNGIDFLEVLDSPTLPLDQRQKTLYVHFIKDLVPNALDASNLMLTGGERIRDVHVTGASIGSGADAKILTVQVDKPGDYSPYTLRLVQSADHPDPPAGFDPLLSAVDFSFKAACPSDFDCEQPRVCPPESQPEPDLDYLAKDYNSFRQLMLDRMSALMPQWQETHAADLGVALVEVLAYVGDHLSYTQDAIATEAYLGTAHSRVSVRRHARLVDYLMHDGCNARAWVQVQVNADDVLLPAKTRLLTLVPGQGVSIAPNSLAYQDALNRRPEIFETMQDATLFQAHNEMDFYTWGALECCLPKGATRATLLGHLTNLKVGDLLVFEEVLGPQSGNPSDADRSHRCAVRLTWLDATRQDPLGGMFADPPNPNPVDVTEITWGQEDALPFPLCLSSKTDVEHGETETPNVSVARGNIVLADNGLTVGESLGVVPDPILFSVAPAGADRCVQLACGETSVQGGPAPVPPRFRPALSQEPLTFAAPHDPKSLSASASATLATDPHTALPEISLSSVSDGETADWTPQRDLLNSAADATDFVVEVENDGTAYLRFGDDEHGLRPASGTTFTAQYRVGNGVRGNVGAEALAHIVSADSAIVKVRNPLPAQGGVEEESIEDVRQRAPSAFRTQARAVTPDDYAAMAQLYPGVQRAAATFRWTGSWRTVFLTVDRLGGVPVDDAFKDGLCAYLDALRMAGHDVEVDGPIYVSLEIDMLVCAKPDYFNADVKEALLEIFSDRVLPDGTLGVFHPDNFSFGQPVYLSQLIARAQAVEGVASVTVRKFQRQGIDSDQALTDGYLSLGRLEIARLDNDPNFPEHGVFSLEVEGGK